ILIRGALILDGTGRPGREGDVVVAHGRIAEVGSHLEATASRTIDAHGLAVAPGFIDLHAHSDLAVLHDDRNLAAVTQGVTTQVVGQDGLSYAPAGEQTVAILREQLAGWNGPQGADVGWPEVA